MSKAEEDALIFPTFCYFHKGKIKPFDFDGEYNSNYYCFHHFIKQRFMEDHPERYEKVKHLQRMLLVKRFYIAGNQDIHSDVHSAMSNERFKAKYGFEKKDILFDPDELDYYNTIEFEQKWNNKKRMKELFKPQSPFVR